jgi:hypothetical protein
MDDVTCKCSIHTPGRREASRVGVLLILDTSGSFESLVLVRLPNHNSTDPASAKYSAIHTALHDSACYIERGYRSENGLSVRMLIPLLNKNTFANSIEQKALYGLARVDNSLL